MVYFDINGACWKGKEKKPDVICTLEKVEPYVLENLFRRVYFGDKGVFNMVIKQVFG
jgi:hypothetical protein